MHNILGNRKVTEQKFKKKNLNNISRSEGGYHKHHDSRRPLNIELHMVIVSPEKQER